MQLQRLTVRGYRSLVDVSIDFGGVTVVQGGNGTGKTNLYRALGLAVAAAEGSLSRASAAEGGMGSVLWAGPKRKGPRRVHLALEWEDLRYVLELGLPQAGGDDPFPLDPEVKHETIELRDGRRWLPAAQRDGITAFVRNDEGMRVTFPFELWRGESFLSQIRSPRDYPIPADVRARLADWRLHHEFRIGSDSPARSPQLGVRTQRLATDGSDLAAAVATIQYSGDAHAFARRLDLAFPGAVVGVDIDERGGFLLSLDTGLNRPLTAAELSDGTLRFLYLLTALSSPDPAGLIALNEPEASLHPGLLEPLAAIMRKWSDGSQLWVTTHSEGLAAGLESGTDVRIHRLSNTGGATQVLPGTRPG